MTDAVADRFSEIPDELIRQIYSFLDMKEVLGTTILSKRWRYLWRSLTNLNFNQHTWCSTAHKMTAKGREEIRLYVEENMTAKEREKSCQFVEQVLLRRDGPNIQKLRLFNFFCACERLLAWLDTAVMQHVQEIHLERVNIPYLFACEVKTLVLKNCKYYENLPRTTFTISSSRLSYLFVENSAYYNKFLRIAICAPNLTTLQLKGNMFDGYSMGNLFALVTAEIDLHITDMYSKTRDICRSCFSHIFSGVCNVESLTLPTHCLKFLPGLFDELEMLPVSFGNLKHLKLTEWREHSYIGVMAKLIGCFPKLEILILERTEAHGSEKEGDWEATLSSDSMLGHLRVIEFQKFDGSKNGYKFLEFVLKNAIVLEHIVLKVAKKLSEEKVKEMVDFSKKLHSMLKASPRATIRLTMKIEGRHTILFEESSSLSKSPLPVVDTFSLNT